MNSPRPHRRRSTAAAVLAALAAGALFALIAASCTGDKVGSIDAPERGGDAEIPAAQLARSGGDASVDNTGANAFAQAAPGLDRQQRRAFVVGNNFFNDNWVTAPASTTARDGLGPLFNAQSCSSCHFKDGRGQPPTPENPKEKGLLLRLSVPGTDPHGGPNPHPVYGGQFQDQSIQGVPTEGRIDLTWREIPGSFDDGTPYVLTEPVYSLVDLGYGPLGDDVMLSPRIAPPVFGSGLLEAVPETTLKELVRRQAEGDDDVSGKLNMVWSPRTETLVPGRFGWKANVGTVEDQSAGAFHGDIGITSSLHPTQDCMPAQVECLAAPDGGTPNPGDPEITDEKLDRVVFYTRTLAVPNRRDIGLPETDRGSELFDQLQCSACHVRELRTGDTDVAPLSKQTIRPYTDLLVHDMGPGLADDRPDFLATGSEWRTPPLWGIGLTEAVNRHSRFLHDGRARNLTEAVLWHGGEAEASQKAFLALDKNDRSDLIAFLQSL